MTLTHWLAEALTAWLAVDPALADALEHVESRGRMRALAAYACGNRGLRGEWHARRVVERMRVRR